MVLEDLVVGQVRSQLGPAHYTRPDRERQILRRHRTWPHRARASSLAPPALPPPCPTHRPSATARPFLENSPSFPPVFSWPRLARSLYRRHQRGPLRARRWLHERRRLRRLHLRQRLRPFSKRFGTGSGGIVEVEVVTADGQIRIANAHQNADLFFALRGGGGTFGIATRVTLLTHPIPDTVGIITGSVQAKSDRAYRELIQRFVEFYPHALDNPTWGESVAFGPDNSLGFRLTFLDRPLELAQADMDGLVEPLRARPDDFEVAPAYRFLPFRDLWNPAYWDAHEPGFITRDPRPDAPDHQFWWSGNQGEVSVFWNSYQSRWIPTALMKESPARLAGALFAASRLRPFIFQINKGLSGEHPEARARDEQTALHPQAFDAAALVIMASAQRQRYRGVAGREPDLEASRHDRDQASQAMAAIAAVTPGAGCYSTEADYFLKDWQQSQWGENYPRLLAIKQTYDPTNLFHVRHGVGSEHAT